MFMRGKWKKNAENPRAFDLRRTDFPPALGGAGRWQRNAGGCGTITRLHGWGADLGSCPALNRAGWVEVLFHPKG